MKTKEHPLDQFAKEIINERKHTKRTFHQLGRCTYDVNTVWVGIKQYIIRVEGVGNTWYLGSKRPTFSQIEYKVIALLEQKGILK